ncbi:MAG: ABC transporter permease [Defluviitaleaceae bacterium]|nr:ABC transporter permease [Defluviitaleaceae bacterium]
MRQRTPKGGGRIAVERMGIWKKLSFNTRYALKNSFRNKGRFLAVVLGMCGSCALLAFSLGFKDSIINTQNQYFNEFANYDITINFDPLPLSIPHPATGQIDESQKALIMPVEIFNDNYMLTVIDTEHYFDMLNIPNDALSDGIIIPEFFADEWGIALGDILDINGYETIVSAIIPQFLGLTIFTSFEYLGNIMEMPELYNIIYGRSADITALIDYLVENNINFSTIDDARTSFDSIMESMEILILFMIACAVILGFTVLYSVGMINLSAREYEYMFMGIMGYPNSSILAAHIKETIMQLIIAIPSGFILGNLLLKSIRGEFSGDQFVISAAVFPQSYVISALTVIGVTAIMALVMFRHIGKLDIVEGLKIRDE